MSQLLPSPQGPRDLCVSATLGCPRCLSRQEDGDSPCPEGDLHVAQGAQELGTSVGWVGVCPRGVGGRSLRCCGPLSCPTPVFYLRANMGVAWDPAAQLQARWHCQQQPLCQSMVWGPGVLWPDSLSLDPTPSG